jgi:hypothetical protein
MGWPRFYGHPTNRRTEGTRTAADSSWFQEVVEPECGKRQQSVNIGRGQVNGKERICTERSESVPNSLFDIKSYNVS